jgi:CRISPR-associated protein Cas2
VQYVICYDIADDRRRDRLAALLLNYGKRVQESVFVANLDGELAERMTAEVQKVLDAEQDRVHIFHLCGACVEGTVVFGTAEVVEDRAWYVV